MIRARSQSAPLGCVSLRSLLVWLVVGLQFATRSLAPKNARSHSVSQSVSSARLDRAIYIAVCVCVCVCCLRSCFSYGIVWYPRCHIRPYLQNSASVWCHAWPCSLDALHGIRRVLVLMDDLHCMSLAMVLPMCL